MAGLTVAEADGTPSLSGVDTIRFNQADGFSLTEPVAGTVKVNYSPASAPDHEARLLAFVSIFNRGA